jgi:Domain of unknown function (DUF1707)/Cell wall-active antibiotics response 4TMS YvqF
VELPDEPRPEIRASDADRQATVVALRNAVGQGRLTLDEFGDRTGAALAAVTTQELTRITADLPATPSLTLPKATNTIVSIAGFGKRTGRWRLASRCRIFCVASGATLDLSEVVMSSSVTDIKVFVAAGSVRVLVPEGVSVDLTGFALAGSNHLDLVDKTTGVDAPVLRIRAITISGSTDVVSKDRTTAR